MKPLAELSRDTARALRAIFCDIDDTLTTHGRLHPGAYAALWRLAEAGLAVVPVTGRPAGWADPLARMWPVAGVIAENGAVAFWLDEQRTMRRWYARAPKDMKADQARLLETAFRIVRETPECRVAADQPFRISDVAVDFAEEVGPLSLDIAEDVRRRFAAVGASAKVSSIHVNAWFGEHDKATACARFARERCGVTLESGAAAFVGDSPNDEPLFARFAVSFGVANVARFAGRMAHQPQYVAAADGGEGFSEIAERILELRAEGKATSAGRSAGCAPASRTRSGRGRGSARRR
jgi:HAD superfamily hydrolase (TIGR01484 family)